MKRRDFFYSSCILGSAILLGCNSTQGLVETRKINSTANELYIPPNSNRIKMSYEQTGNQLATAELMLPPKMCGPAPHYHDELDEIVRVVSGTLTLMVEDEVVKVPEGGWHFRPRKKVHSFWNETDEPVRFIEIYPNQNFDVFLKKIWTLRDSYAAKGLTREAPELWQEQEQLNKQWGITGYPERRNEIIKKYGLRG